MSMRRIRSILSILMDSPLYLTLSLKERHSLLTRMAKDYPFLAEAESELTEGTYESSWAGILR